MTLQSYDVDFNPATNKITTNTVINGSGAGMTGTRTDTNYIQLTTVNGIKYAKEINESTHWRITENGKTTQETANYILSNNSPYVEFFLMRSSLGSLSPGYSTTLSGAATETFTDSSGTTTQNGQTFDTWTIASIIPSMTVQGVNYSNVIEVRQSTKAAETSTWWVAKGIGIIKATMWDDYRMNGTDHITIELKSTNLTTTPVAPSVNYSVSGRITLNGAALTGVSVTLTGSGSTTTTTDSSGNYSFTGAQNGSYTVMPIRAGYAFTPGNRSVTVNGANVTAQDFSSTSSGTSITDPTTGMVLLKVTGSTYTMGDTFGDGFSYELPTHQVTVGDFYIGKYEVTQAEWQAVMGNNPSYFTACGTNCPVENVSWNDVQIFITTLNQRSGKNYRLPTEAEWEYAARSGGQSQKYSGGSDVNAVAWYYDNSAVTYIQDTSGRGPHPVGQKQANGLGLYDMSGNVWEWVSDWYGAYSSAAQTNPTGPATGTGRVIRGGCLVNVADYVRASHRYSFNPDARGFGEGFRLAAPVQ